MISNYHTSALSRMTENEFYGDLFVNERVSGIKIEYKNNHEMHLHGLLPENPPHIALERNKIHYSHDGENFTTLENDFGFQVFRILDPRIISSDEFEPTLLEENPLSMRIKYYCKKIHRNFKFHTEFLKRMEEKNDHERECFLHFENGKIAAMKQFNIYSSTDILEIRFKEDKDPDLKFCQKNFSQIVQ